MSKKERYFLVTIHSLMIEEEVKAKSMACLVIDFIKIKFSKKIIHLL